MIEEQDYKNKELRNILNQILVKIKKYTIQNTDFIDVSFRLTDYVSEDNLNLYIPKINYIFSNINNIPLYVVVNRYGQVLDNGLLALNPRLKITTIEQELKRQRVLSYYSTL